MGPVLDLTRAMLNVNPYYRAEPGGMLDIFGQQFELLRKQLDQIKREIREIQYRLDMLPPEILHEYEVRNKTRNLSITDMELLKQLGMEPEVKAGPLKDPYTPPVGQEVKEIETHAPHTSSFILKI